MKKQLVAICLILLVSSTIRAEDTVNVTDELAKVSKQIALLQARMDYLTALQKAGVTQIPGKTTSTSTPTVSIDYNGGMAVAAPGLAVGFPNAVSVNGQLFLPVQGAGACQAVDAGACGASACSSQQGASYRTPIRTFFGRTRLFGGPGIFRGRAGGCGGG